jgi:hypothetical protein
MDKVQKLSNSERYTPSSESIRSNFMFVDITVSKIHKSLITRVIYNGPVFNKIGSMKMSFFVQ